MRRVISVRFPNFPIERLRRTGAVPPGDGPVVTSLHDGRRRVVAAAGAAAWVLGVAPGMAVAQAQALVPGLHVPEDQAVAARPPAPQLWLVTDAIRHIGDLLPVLPDGSALEKFQPPNDPRAANRSLRCRAAMATTLVAGLELARNEALTLEQGALWGEISVHRLSAASAEPTAVAARGG
jgi:hypothetical protein